ncbi:23S rRNA (uracil(1939)-C(5))-methyltransferase RlmD [Gilvibacter sediminis]|uniref:23S rRNA (uracil(1939)-C(5))-methyltransferase RlmD n=1 Tax=Gilvibacter sediminis TaxID=379071 RepID=UPI0023502529|nr:23S rRNA (uracil(1939)-C(5))-methyltransferase RlmD [Gilvibacter sediminis]MDC7997800.1 23S rRNA (uracil(1939)-C(5))-methyltransferase RlmD [Gilvibacter sediminis]
MARKRNRKVFEALEIIDAGAKGKAVAKAPDGRVVFIDNAVPGDVATIQTTKKRSAYYHGTAIEFQSYSDKRVEPACAYFGTCGGCKWQNMGYPHQLEYKQREVTQNLKRLGGIEPQEIIPIKGCDTPYFYRNKMEFSFSNNKWLTLEQINSGEAIEDRNALGFHIPGMWDKILDIDQCHLQADPSNAIRNFVRDFAKEKGLAFFDPRAQQGLLRTLMIRNTSIGEIMVLIQFYDNDQDAITLVLEAVKQQFPEITSLLYVINQKANDTLYDQDILVHSGRDHIIENMEGLEFKINAKSFYQTNSEQAYELYKIAREFAGLNGTELVYDLYTGTGTIAQFVSKQAAKVIGVEAVPEAIEAAKANAQHNKIDNCEFYVGDMKNIFNQEFIDTHGAPDLVITDPPRDGMHKDVVAQLLQLEAPKIVYVSCNSATQARDLQLLAEKYEVVKSQAVDMFPQTHHVENVVLLTKR